jgi:uncharacterized protein YacL
MGVFIVCVDILAPRKKLSLFSGAFFGLLVGISIAFALSFVTPLIIDQYEFMTSQALPTKTRDAVITYINLLIGTVTCYLSISFILQTKDDFRFIVPYVEFSKQTKGARPILLDTSVLIDGRISDIADTGIVESQLVIPRFILQELQAMADSADKLRRAKGRRGLDMLHDLQGNARAELVHYDSSGREDITIGPVDEQLMRLAKDLNGRVMTTDFNLNKVAQLRGVDVININDLANAMKPVVMPGERMRVRLLKAGAEPGQGVGYLDDGTMVVVEQGRNHLNEEVEFTVTNTVQKSAGKMIFGRMDGNGSPGGDAQPSAQSMPPRRQKHRHEPETTERA